MKAGLENRHDDSVPAGAPFRLVGPVSPLSWRRAVEKLAYYFRREFGYDFPPYEASEVENWDLAKDRVLVFIKKTTLEDWEDYFYFVGAVGMRWRKWDDVPHGWGLAWAWLHPYERRKGLLTQAWPFLTEKFPAIRIEAPVSEAMLGFLKRVGYREPEPRFMDAALGVPPDVQI